MAIQTDDVAQRRTGARNGTNITSAVSSELEELAREEREKGLNWMHEASENTACLEPWMGKIERTWKIVQFVIAFIIPLAVISEFQRAASNFPPHATLRLTRFRNADPSDSDPTVSARLVSLLKRELELSLKIKK